jgi:hypothetical protein
MLEDYAALQAAGHQPQLRIGPWTHTAAGLAAAGHRDGIAWLRAHLLDDDRLVRRSPVRIFVTGERSGGGWRDLPTWPPPGTGERGLWLGAAATLSEREPAEAGADRYRYDPLDPTPSLGGPVLLVRQPVVDNRSLESRPDVLTFSTPALTQTLEAVGPVGVELWATASSNYFDLFARLCDVDAEGTSWNVCDALARVAPGRFERGPDNAWRVGFALWPTAHRFAAGNRLRLQVSSGAHPRYARNPGTGEDPLTATEMMPVDVQILWGGAHASRLVLPAAAESR